MDRNTDRKHSYLGSASAHYTEAVLDYFEAQGIPADEVFGADWVARIRHAPERHRLQVDQWQAVLRRAVEHLADPLFPIKLAATIRPRHLGLLGFLVMSCENLGQSALILQRYEHLLDSVNMAQWQIVDGHCHLSWHTLVPSAPSELTLLSMSLWVMQGRWLSGRDELTGTVNLTQPAPSTEVHAQFEHLLGMQVRFGQALNEVVLPAHYIELPVVQRDRHVHALLRSQADADLASLLGQDHDFLAQLEALLLTRLESGELALQDVAQAMGIAPRTLQHKLDEHGATFRQLLDKVRSQQAHRHLRNPKLSLAEVAMMLGFADQSSFQHAFKRWTGVSPGEFRRRQLSTIS